MFFYSFFPAIVKVLEFMTNERLFREEYGVWNWGLRQSDKSQRPFGKYVQLSVYHCS